MFYSYDRIRSYNAIWNFIISNRGGGKTYGFKMMGIKNFLKNGKQFIYVRRYKTELTDKNLFFDDVKHNFPNLEFKIHGNTMYINDKPCGYFISLSTSQQKKSVSYPNVDLIGFDEFIIDKSHMRYLSNEVEVALDLYETVNRQRTGKNKVKMFFMGNNISLVNPYFRFFDCIPTGKERFTVAKNGQICIELFTDEEFIKSKLDSEFGELTKGTKYAEYSIENKSLRDNNAFVEPNKPKDCTFILSILYDGIEIGFWLSRGTGIIYCDKKIVDTKARYTITKEDHKLNYYMFNSLSTLPTFKELTKYFRYGDMLFKDIDTKNHVYDIFNFMGIR